MNKIATYLNQHLLGDVSGAKTLRKHFSTDASVLTITPEIVAFPRVTNDIRKIARFTWQLAEKGHVLGVTVRGGGGDETGGAIGKGVLVDTSPYLRNIITIAAKDRLVHVQPGVTFSTLNQTLKWQGLALAQVGADAATVGGAIASGDLGASGYVGDAIEKLEIVLANGDIIETGRLSKRELSKKLGEQTLEGEIYRRLEGLIEDNDAIISEIAADTHQDNTGYRRISAVKQKDGSFDLTPLFIGSQGTLGIISEVVLKADFYSQDKTCIALTTDSRELARDVADTISDLQPSTLTILDGDTFRTAVKQGAEFTALGDVSQLGAVVYIELNDFNDRVQANKLKRIRKYINKLAVGIIDSTTHSADEFSVIKDVRHGAAVTSADDHAPIPLLNGASIPANRREEFETAFAELAKKHHTELSVEVAALTGTYTISSPLKLSTVSDKQKLFRLLTDYADLVLKSDGSLLGTGAEGRVKANAALALLSEGEQSLHEQIRTIFDPFGTLNPGVKQKADIRTIVAALRSSYDVDNLIR